MATKVHKSKAEQHAAIAAYKRLEKWSSKHEGYSVKDPVLGKLVWSLGQWTTHKTIPLVGKRAKVTIYEGRSPAEYDMTGPPEPVGAWAGQAWSKFIEDCPPDRKDEAYEVLHREVVRRAKMWLTGPMKLEDSSEEAEIVKKYRDSSALLKKSLRLLDVSLDRGDKKAHIGMDFETDFDPEHGLQLYYVVGRKKLVTTL